MNVEKPVGVPMSVATAVDVDVPSRTIDQVKSASISAAHPSKLLGIEVARGIAATMVVFYHASNHMSRNIGFKPAAGLAQFGHAGVDFFFVLSGFIIYFVHHGDLGRAQRLGHYVQRRFVRIFPIYWFVILVTLVLGLALSAHEQPLSLALYSATLLPTVDDPYVGVAWTLQHEMIFYALFATSILNRRLGRLTFGIWLAAIVANGTGLISVDGSSLGPVLGATIARLVSFFNIEFFLGMFAASLLLAGRIRNPRTFLVIGCLLFCTVALCEDFGAMDGFAVSARLAYGLSSMLLVLGASGIVLTRSLASRALMSMGSASYSIYLTHLLFIGIVYKAAEVSGLFSRMPVLPMYLIMSVTAVYAGIVVSRFVEYPLMRLVRTRLINPFVQRSA